MMPYLAVVVLIPAGTRQSMCDMHDHDLAIDQHYGRGGLLARIDAALAAAGADPANLKPADLSPVDAFHSRGREATLELIEMGDITPTDRVLDVGCGIGGAARHIAHEVGCRVDGFDLTQEYIDVGNVLTRRVGLEALVSLLHASALDMPFDADTFDIAWTEHVQMNIADKRAFYAEISRVLRPGGVLLFHDIFDGGGGDLTCPVPWAEVPAHSILAQVDDAKNAMSDAGLQVMMWTDTSEKSLAFFESVLARIAQHGPPPLGIHLLMGDTAKQKIINYVDNLRNGRTTIAMGCARKVNA